MHDSKFRFLSLILILGGIHALEAKPLPPSLPDSSLYQVDSRWQDDEGKTLRLSGLRGQVRVVSLFYTGCDNLCPMILGQLKSLEAAMPADIKDKVGFVLITMDSKNDSSGALRAYRKKSNLTHDHWVLLRGAADDTREVAELLGVHYTPKDAKGQMGHTGVIAILDRDGRILARVSGITDQKAFLAELARALSAKP